MEKELETADPGIRDVLARLKAAPSMRVSADFHARVMDALAAQTRGGRRARRLAWAQGFAAAASITLLLGAFSLMRTQSADSPASREEPEIALADGSRPSASVAPYTLSYAVRALVADGLAQSEALSRAVAEMVRSQNADGGWGVPALTAMNTAALGLAARAGDRAATLAWKRGVRHLRTHGMPDAGDGDFPHGN